MRMNLNKSRSSDPTNRALLRAAVGVWSLLVCSLLSAPVSAQVYDVTRDFDPAHNPAGVWTYGYCATPNTPFAPFTVNGAVSYQDGDNAMHLNGWQNGFDPNLGVFQNGTGRRFQGRTTSYEDGEIAMHPGRSREMCLILWTAPAKGLYKVQATFRMNSTGKTDVHLVIKGNEVINTLLSSPSDTVHYSSKAVEFDEGETINFAVGDGGDGYRYDTTGLAARVEAVNVESDRGAGAIEADNAEPNRGAGNTSSSNYKGMRSVGTFQEASSGGVPGWLIGLPVVLVGGVTSTWAVRRYNKRKHALQQARIPVEFLRQEVLEGLIRVDTYLDLLPPSPGRDAARMAREQAMSFLRQGTDMFRKARTPEDYELAQILLEKAKQATERVHSMIH